MCVILLKNLLMLMLNFVRILNSVFRFILYLFFFICDRFDCWILICEVSLFCVSWCFLCILWILLLMS